MKAGTQKVATLALTLMVSLGQLLAEEQISSNAPAPSPAPSVDQIYHDSEWKTPPSQIDQLVFAELNKHNIVSAQPCNDAVFIRRIYIDITGTMPSGQQVKAFLQDPASDKRARLIDELLYSENFTDYWTLKWCDVLRVKSEFPINLWPKGVQSYQRWIRQQIQNNLRYDEFARALLLANGSNFRQAEVNFYRSGQGNSPADIAEIVALTFMGSRTDRWSEENVNQLASFFSQLKFKQTQEWKEEIVFHQPAPTPQQDYIFPDGSKISLAAGEDPRIAFTNWLVNSDNQWFTQSICNRIWYWLMGQGIIHPADDIHPSNPASNPALLEYLQNQLVNADYDLKALYREILNSRTYQQSSIARTDDAKSTALFAHYALRRLDAEVLIDALNEFGNTVENYWSPIPEPFTFIPKDNRTITLADGSITSQFLDMFGRPSRDTGYLSEREHTPNEFQRLYLLNSQQMHVRVRTSPLIRKLSQRAAAKPEQAISELYLNLLARYPSEDEMQIAMAYRAKHLPAKTNNQQRANKNKKQAAAAEKKRQNNRRTAPPANANAIAIQDIAWALINSKEFLYNH